MTQDEAVEEGGPRDRGVTRRGLFGLIGLGAAAGAALGAGAAVGVPAAVSAATAPTGAHPFAGAHQAGITTAAQDRLHFAAFDLASGSTRDDLVALLRAWSDAARAMTAGAEIGATGADGGGASTPPDDTGEAVGLPASNLTITFGFGPTLFEQDGVDRFGLAAARPASLQPLPRFQGDALDPAASGGDLCVQACADDPQVAVHAIRNLSRIAFGTASIRWSQLGFGRTSSTSTSQATPRNLFGFKDGTANVKAEERAAVDEHVWIGAGDGPAWLVGGSYLVARRIRMEIEVWDRAQLGEQERVVGRDKREGAPLSGGVEATELDLDATGAAGQPLIDASAHVRLAHPSRNGGVRLLRRGYNYVDGNDALGRLDAGLFFISFQRDPESFIAVQRSLGADAMNEYLKHTGSAIFAVPPGASATGWVGETLFG